MCLLATCWPRSCRRRRRPRRDDDRLARPVAGEVAISLLGDRVQVGRAPSGPNAAIPLHRADAQSQPRQRRPLPIPRTFTQREQRLHPQVPDTSRPFRRQEPPDAPRQHPSGRRQRSTCRAKAVGMIVRGGGCCGAHLQSASPSLRPPSPHPRITASTPSFPCPVQPAPPTPLSGHCRRSPPVAEENSLPFPPRHRACLRCPPRRETST